jgi:hypothetical protein
LKGQAALLRVRLILFGGIRSEAAIIPPPNAMRGLEIAKIHDSNNATGAFTLAL